MLSPRCNLKCIQQLLGTQTVNALIDCSRSRVLAMPSVLSFYWVGRTATFYVQLGPISLSHVLGQRPPVTTETEAPGTAKSLPWKAYSINKKGRGRVTPGWETGSGDKNMKGHLGTWGCRAPSWLGATLIKVFIKSAAKFPVGFTRAWRGWSRVTQGSSDKPGK